MPLISRISPCPESLLLTWKIEEDESFFQQKLGALAEGCLHFKDPLKRLQWLAVRVALQTEGIHTPLRYLESGKPLLEGRFVSLSHSTDHVCIYLSSRSEVGVDIEKEQPRIRKIATRFMHESEKETFGTGDLFTLTLIWSVKEALFKKHGGETTFFASRQRLLEWDKTAQIVVAEVENAGQVTKERLRYFVVNNFIVTYTLSA